MITIPRHFAFMAALLVPIAAFSQNDGARDPIDLWVPGEVIVKFKTTAIESTHASALRDVATLDPSLGDERNMVTGVDDAMLRHAEQLTDAASNPEISRVDDGSIRLLHSRTKDVNALINTLRQLPDVLYVEPNYIRIANATPNDPMFAAQWNMPAIKAVQAWDKTTGSRNVVIAVLDDGVNYPHPDLAANMWSNPGGIGGCAAGTHGYNSSPGSWYGTCNPRPGILEYHGTHIAGIAGAVGSNGIGIAGVSQRVSIMALRFSGLDTQNGVCDQSCIMSQIGSGGTAAEIAALEFAIAAKRAGENVRIVNISYGFRYSQAEYDEMAKLNVNNILVVASAGNYRVNTDTTPQYPAGYNLPNIISVAATDTSRALWVSSADYGSNYGANTVDLGAPGVGIRSTNMQYVFGENIYTNLEGTSMAAPHVAGVAALLLANDRFLTTAELRRGILNNTTPSASLAGKTVTGGILDADRAVSNTPLSGVLTAVLVATRMN